MSTQLELLSVCALCGGRTWQGRGRLVVTVIDDGRAVIRLEDGTKAGLWLELLPDDRRWLVEVIGGNELSTRRSG